MLITSKNVADKARKNKRFIRFLKETYLFKEYFRNVNNYGFKYMQTHKINKTNFIELAFRWVDTNKPEIWPYIQQQWVNLIPLRKKERIKQVINETVKRINEC